MFLGENKIRVKAICVIISEDKLFVSKLYDSVSMEYYYRPIGGNVEFGESTKETIKREIKEELNTEVEDIKLLEILENIFTCEGKKGHEILFIYSGIINDSEYYKDKIFTVKENNGQQFVVEWIDIKKFHDNELKLVPKELLSIISEKRKSGILTTASTGQRPLS